MVTGGAGFIGSSIVRRLLADGHEVRVHDNFSTGHGANIDGLDVEVIEGDLRSYERVASAARGCEVIFHQGALPSVPRSIQDPLTSNAVNVEGTLNVLLAARDHGVRRVVFASSSSIYGDAPGMPRREDAPVAPLAPYAVAKLAAEQYCMAAGRVYDIQAVALRYFNVFGERQDPLFGLRRGDPEVHLADARRRAPDDQRRRAHRPRLHPHRQRRRRQPRRRGGSRRRWEGDEHRDGRLAHPARARRPPERRCSDAISILCTGRSVRGTSRGAKPTSRSRGS